MKLARPAELWLLLRMSAWAAVLPALKFVLPLPRLVRLVTPHRRAGARDVERERRVARLAARLYRGRAGRRDNCLERSLVTYRYLARLSAEPRLVVGVRKQDAVEGHVWVTVDEQPVHDAPDAVASFVPVTTFSP